MCYIIRCISIFSFLGGLAEIFEFKEGILHISISAFRMLSIGFVFAGISLALSSIFQAFGNGTFSLIVKLFRKILVVLPLIILLKSFFLYTIWNLVTIAEVIVLIVEVLLYRNIRKNIIVNICEEVEKDQ